MTQNTDFAQTDLPAPERFTLRRSRDVRVVGGVCGGLAESLDVDVTLVRLAVIALTVFAGGLGAVFYIAAWALAPLEDVAAA